MARMFDILVTATEHDLKTEWENAVEKYSDNETHLLKKKRSLQRELQIENNETLKESFYIEMVDMIQKDMDAQNAALKSGVEKAYENLVRELVMKIDYSFDMLSKIGAYMICKLDKYDYNARTDFELKALKSDIFPHLKFPSRKYGMQFTEQFKYILTLQILDWRST